MRTVALGHLARHARQERPAAYLRTCSCRTDGCRWHGRHRGCGGEVALVLFCRLGGRSWHLADVCEECARAVPAAARVRSLCPDGEDRSPAAGPGGDRDGRSGERAEVEMAARLAGRAALGYTGASLPSWVGGEARLLAVVCALRVRVSGFAALPVGFVRSLGLSGPGLAVAELQDAGWLHFYGRPRGGPAVFVPELAGQRVCRRAGHWGVRQLTRAPVRGLGAEVRLAALLVAAWREPGGGVFRLDPQGAARSCGLSPDGLAVALGKLCAAGLLSGWGALASGLFECVP